MERVTISIDEKLGGAFDALIASRRSEALRDVVHREVETASQATTSRSDAWRHDRGRIVW